VTKDEIVAAILKVAGNPTAGVLKELAPAMADEILSIGKSETRASKAVETRETR
jgi:hypothetical protein